MFCIKCGFAVSDSDSFCSGCGHPIKEGPQTECQPSETNAGDNPTQPSYGGISSYSNTEQPTNPGKPLEFKPLYAMIAGAALLLVACGIWGGHIIYDAITYKNILSKAQDAAVSDDLDEAVELYRDALAERSDDPAALAMLDSTLADTLAQGLGRAKELVAKGNVADALAVLKELPISDGDKQYDEYMDYIIMLDNSPSVTSIDASMFPTVSIHIKMDGGVVSTNSISVTDDNKAVATSNLSDNNSEIVVTYLAEDSSDGGVNRDVSLVLTAGEFAFPLNCHYVTPVFQDATVTLVSTDFSDYPTVHAFFRVQDALTKQYIAELSPKSFSIKERVSGGAYVAREVKSAEPLLFASGKYGINIALVADKSDSIGGSMSKIKTVMREFVGSLALSDGDRAELIAFDDVPQLMCTFTNDASRLNNGITNMETDGMTAFYDAVYQGVRNAALQGGAKCVIAFTDGADNMSSFTADSVIRFANEKQVPLYIIGVGDSYTHDILKTMASETRGRYWYIDDLYDLKEIYSQIYGELRELYVVSYDSDGAVEPMAERGLEISLRGGGYKGGESVEFSPAKTADDSVRASRYEIFLEDVSWEEANERCLERGGHLVTITSKAENDLIIALAEANGAEYVWLGGYTSYDSYNNVFGHWITGEDFIYENWMHDEPSRHDKDGIPEWYLMLWNIASEGGWSWNDQRNELASEFPSFRGKLAYVCEYE